MNENNINKALYGFDFDWHKSISKRIELANKKNNLFGLTDMTKFVKQSYLYEKSVGLNSMLGIFSVQNIHNMLKAPKQMPSPFLSFTSQITQIIQQQENIAKRLLPISNLNLSSSLLQNFEKIKQQSIPSFANAFIGLAEYQQKQQILEISIRKYLTNSIDYYVRQDNREKDFDGIINDMQNLTSVMLEIKNNQQITKENLSVINATLEKADTSSFMFFIIQIILSLFLYFNDSKPEGGSIKNIKVNNIEKKEIEICFNKTLNVLCLEQRKAIIKANLRSQPHINSAKIALIPKGQLVLVQNINHKWMYVVYQDKDYLLKVGWVFKKSFEKINNTNLQD